MLLAGRRRPDLVALGIEIAESCWYPLLLLAGTLAVDGQPPDLREGLLDALSTDLANLHAHPVRSLLGSAFVAESHLAVWVVLAFTGLVVTARRLGPGPTAALVATVHVGATGISQAVVWHGLRAGALPESARHLRDVGPSYVVVAALIAGIVVGPGLLRLLPGLGFAVLVPFLFGGLADLEVSAMGHTASVVLAAIGAPAAAWWRDRRTAGTGSPGSGAGRAAAAP